MKLLELGHKGLWRELPYSETISEAIENIRVRQRHHPWGTFLGEAIRPLILIAAPQRLLDPDYVAPEPRVYRRNKQPRPVLAKSRSAFVFATH